MLAYTACMHWPDTCFEREQDKVQGLFHQGVQDVAGLQVEAGQAEEAAPEGNGQAGLLHEARLPQPHHPPQH